MKEIIKTIKTSTVSLLMLALMFMVVEPAIGNAIEDQFIVTQQITSEISFLTPSTDITMSPSLAGITGGQSDGQTTVKVLTNNALGYTMTLIASSSVGMSGRTQGGTIPAYVLPAGTSTPEYDFTVPSNKAYFGYTVEASTTADLATAFKDTGSICGAGSSDTVDKCWINASTTARQIINRSSATAASGATTTIKFRTVIQASPVPAIPEDYYYATTTLTATTN